MPLPFWGEYARVQRLVELGKARDEQLDALLSKYHHAEMPSAPLLRLKLHDAELTAHRTELHRLTLLKRDSAFFNSRFERSPHDSAVIAETSAAVRNLLGDDWQEVCATLDGNYAEVARVKGIPVGTLKARVWRLKASLRSTLAKHIDELE